MTSLESVSRDGVAVDAWEEAYLRFETPDEEERKFVRRLIAAGARGWDKQSVVLDLFCGRGGGGRALRRLGFRHVVGLDLSARLLHARTDRSACMVADCRVLPIASASADLVVVQGGLHHLPIIPRDLSTVLKEIARALRPGGIFVAVEPWSTPFLALVHEVCRVPLARRAMPKVDALATMIEHERETYEAWLRSGSTILQELDRHFNRRRARRRLGKLHYVGTPRGR